MSFTFCSSCWNSLNSLLVSSVVELMFSFSFSSFSNLMWSLASGPSLFLQFLKNQYAPPPPPATRRTMNPDLIKNQKNRGFLFSYLLLVRRQLRYKDLCCIPPTHFQDRLSHYNLRVEISRKFFSSLHHKWHCKRDS